MKFNGCIMLIGVVGSGKELVVCYIYVNLNCVDVLFVIVFCVLVEFD